MNSSKEQAVSFVRFLLGHVPDLDLAAADYSSSKVTKVIKAKTQILCAHDFETVAPWLWSKNSKSSNIWVRPAATLRSHPIIMLDDLPSPTSLAISRKYRSAVVETSPANTQIWLVCSIALGREDRQNVARSLCALVSSDPGAISEPRWGRLPGYRQRKPGKSGWTNILTISGCSLLDPTPHLTPSIHPPGGVGGGFMAASAPHDVDTSRQEFAYACHALRAGVDAREVEASIAEHVLSTGRRKP